MTPAAWVPWLGYGLEGAVAALAWPLTVRYRFHRPYALLASLLAVQDVLRGVLGALRDQIPAGRIHPLHGLARAAYELDVLAFLAWPTALGLAAWVAFTRRRWGHLAGAWALAMAATVALYPASRAGWVRPAEHGAALLVGWVALALWARERRWPTWTQALVLLALGTETACAAVAYATGAAREAHPLTLTGYLGAEGVALGIEVVWLRHRSAAA